MDAVWYYVGKERDDVYVLDAGTDPGDWLDQWSTNRVMWDDMGVYYYFEVLDDELDVSEANDYEKDSVELYWDMDNSKNDVTTGYDDNDFQWRVVLYNTTVDAGTGFAPPEGSIAATMETDFGYNVEVYVPTAEWPIVPEADLEVGYEIQINDGDAGTREHLGRWFSDSNETWHDPSYMGTAMFRGADYRTVQDMLDINYVAGAPTIDGEKEAWWDALPNVGMNTYVDAAAETDITLMTGAYDLDFNAWQGWNEEGFYLYVSIIDDEISTANANTYEQDSVELYFDGDNSKNDVTTGYDDNDMQCRMVYMADAIEAGTGTPPAAGVVAWADTDLGMDMECFIPASDIEQWYTLEEGAEIGYEIQINDDDGNGTREGMARWWDNTNETWHDPSHMGEARLTVPESAVEAPVAVPTSFNLGQNYPNPFNPTTSIDYNVASRGYVKLAVYDLLGKEVATLVDGVQPAGKNTVTFSASNLTSGVYFYKLEADNNVITKKMTLLK